MDTFYEKKIECLYCGKKFSTLKVRQNQIRVLKRDSDFCTYYHGEDPTFYDFHVCPDCGLAFTATFSPLTKAKKERIKTEYISKIDKTDFSGVRTQADALKGYKLTLLCASILDEKKLILANVCLRIGWINRMLENHGEERRFLELAMQEYEEIYQTESMSSLQMEEGRLLYLIGELHSRLGHFDATKKWFSYLFTADHIDTKWKKVGRERWLDIKAEQKQSIKEDPEGY